MPDFQVKKSLKLLRRIYTRRNKRAFILLTLTQVMIFLTLASALVIFQTSFKDYKSSRELVNYTKAKFLAQSGLEAALLLLRSVPVAQLYQFGIISHPPPIPLGDGIVTFELQEESGKLNINRLVNFFDGSENSKTREMLDRLAEALKLRYEMWDNVVDWVDDNSVKMPQGAERFEYENLIPPRRIKNNRVHSIEELLLIPGLTYNVLYDDRRTEEEKEEDNDDDFESEEEKVVLTDDDYRLINNITIYLPYNRDSIDTVNINSAPYHVILALSEVMTPQIAEKILIARLKNGGRFSDINQLATIPQLITTKTTSDNLNLFQDLTGGGDIKNARIDVNDKLYKIVAAASVGSQTAHVVGVYDSLARKLTHYME